MIKFVYLGDEHERLPECCIDSSELRKSNETEDYLRWKYDSNGKKVDTGKYSVYCTYAYIETDELTSNGPFNKIKGPQDMWKNGQDAEHARFPITVMDYRPKYSKRTIYIFSEPIWHFIADERTDEQQKFIDKNFDKLNEMFIAFAKSQGYLTDVK